MKLFRAAAQTLQFQLIVSKRRTWQKYAAPARRSKLMVLVPRRVSVRRGARRGSAG